MSPSPAPFARTPSPPYYAVIFSSRLTEHADGYAKMADLMMQLAQGQDGFLGAESARGSNGFGITVSYWQSLESISAWRHHSEHLIAQELGMRQWYEHYELRISKVERAYGKDLMG